MRSDTRSLTVGLALGAGLMYLLDPNRGARRRNTMRDKVVHARRLAREGWDATSHDLANRSRGLAAAARSRLSPDGADDWVVEQRVRAALGRVVSHPSAIAVNASEGRVTLSGPVLADEVEGLLACARTVRGVEAVENRLAVHESGEHVPALQGGRTGTGTQSELRRENWTPSLRLLASLGGGGLAIWGLQRGGVLGAAAGAAGLALLARGSTNTPLDRLVGVGGGRRAVDLQKTITIHAPADRVFAFLTEWERWPQWMSHVREVSGRGTVRGRERTHWVVDGPLGVPVRWDAITTGIVPNEEIAWKTEDGAAVAHAGMIRLVPLDDATRVELRMSYNPPAGVLGHAVAASFGRDPKRQLDDDLARLKTTIETGHAPRDAARHAPETAESAAQAD
ncbi:MAG TPA: SRPBCC family protein [Gemmatimonadales bacterium]